MKHRLIIMTLILCAWTTVNAQEFQAPTFGKGIMNIKAKDDSFKMKIAARFQLLSSFDWDNEDGNLTNPEQSFQLRRSRLKFDGYALSPKLVYKLEIGLSNNDISGASVYTKNVPRYVMDAVIKWNFYENFTLWAGQTKLPGNVERVISSANLQLVDRSLLNSNFNIDRDMGLQLHHQTQLAKNFYSREIVSISQGEGRNVVTGNLGGHQYTGRIELLPLGLFDGDNDYQGSDLKREKTPKLMLAATYDINNNAVRNRSNSGTYMVTDNGYFETNISTIFMDMVFKYNGFSFMGEYTKRNADDPFAKNSDGSLTGDVVQVGNALNLQSGYVFRNNWEVTGRYTELGLDQNVTGKGRENQYTLGVSKFIVGHKLKVQSDLSYLDTPNKNNQLMYRLQMDIHF